MLTPKLAVRGSSRRVEYGFRDLVREAAENRWHFVLQRCGVPASVLTGEKVRYPACGGDGFRYLDSGGRGSFVCRAPSRADAAGDGFAALGHLFRLNFGEAVRMAAEALSIRHRELPTAGRGRSDAA